MTMKGIDISKWQAGINVKNLDIDFMFCKATEGIRYTDPTCNGYIEAAKAKGIPWGYYHFARENDPASEAVDFYNATKGYTKQGIPVLDYEVWGKNGNDVAWCEKFIQKFYDLTGIWCMIYISASHCKDFNGSWIPDRCALWVAGYPNGYNQYTSWPSSNCPYNLGKWKAATIWQFTSSLRLSGYGGNLDGDFAYIDKQGWSKIAGGTGVAPSPSTPSTPSKPSTPSSDYNIWLQSRTANKVLPAVHNNNDNAGIDAPMTYLAAWTNPGTLKVQARTEKSGWLPELINPSDINNGNTGSVGDGSPITGIRMYYNSPNRDKAVHYRVKVEGKGWLPWMIDHKDTGGSMDDFAGNGKRIQRVEAYIGGLS